MSSRPLVVARHRVPEVAVRLLETVDETADVQVALGALDELRTVTSSLELRLIDEARRAGVTWAAIARALDLGTRQAAQSRWQRLQSELLC